MDHRTAGVVLHKTDFPVAGMSRIVAVERLSDGGGNEEHSIQIVPILAQGLASDKALGDRPHLILVVPLEVDVQIHALAAAIVRGTENVRIRRNFPAIFPVAVQDKIFVRQVSGALQPVFQLLEDLLACPLAVVLQLAGVVRRGLPLLKFDGFHFFLPSKSPLRAIWRASS